jgi:hypothetical protein
MKARTESDRKTTGIDSALGPPSARRYHRAVAQGLGLQVQLREDDLPKVLCSSASPCHQLPEEEVRPHESAATEEEDKVVVARMDCGMRWRVRY